MCAQITERAVEGAIIKLGGFKTPRGSAHRKVKMLIDPINDARAGLRAVGVENQLFSNRVTIGFLVRKFKEETQARWCLHLTKAPYSQEEDMFNEWLKIKGRAVEKWRFQRNETD